MSLIFAASGDDSVDAIAGTSSENSGAGSKGILTSPTSFTFADTAYIPYVGGQTTILSLPGTQKQRRSASIASSLPTPRNRFSGVISLEVWRWVLRRLHRSCLRGC